MTVPHASQRYDTVGDYQDIANIEGVSFTVSQMGNPDYEFLVLVHELVEWYLLRRRGLPIQEVDAFDFAHPELNDPGSDPRAPYHVEHMRCLALERTIAKWMGLDWEAYDNFVDGMIQRGRHEQQI